MKIRVVLLLVALLSLPAAGQQNSLVIQQTFSASGSSNWYPIAGYTSHTLTWSQVGSTSVVGCAVQVDSSAVGGSDSGSSGGIITSQSATSNGTTSVTTVSASYARITVTGCSAGTIKVTYSAVNAALSKGGGGGGGGSLPALTNNQIVGGVGTTATALNGLTFTSNALSAFTALEPNTTSVLSPFPIENYGFPGTTNGNCRYFSDYVNQDTSGANVMHQWISYESATLFVNQINQSYWQGWNEGCGGGKAISSDSLMGEGWEMTYTPGGTPSGVWPPSAQGQSQDEHHWTHAGINWPFFQIRNMSMANDTLTGKNDFWQWSTDVGMTWQYATTDGNLINGCTATMSGATGTWTCSGGFPYNYQVSSSFVAGCPVVGAPGCVAFTPSGYNTLWTIVSGGAGTTTLTATAYSGVSGLGAGSGGKIYGSNGGQYASLTPANGWATNGPIPITAGGSVIVNDGGNVGQYGLRFFPGNTNGGQNVLSATDFYGSQGSTTTCNNLTGINASNTSIFLGGTGIQPLGTFCPPSSTAAPQDVVAPHVAAVLKISLNPSATGTQPDLDFKPISQSGVEFYSDYSTSANNCGFLNSAFGVGQANFFSIGFQRGTCTSLTNIIMGGYSGVTASFRGGATEGVGIDASGNPNFSNTVKYHGTAGISQTGVLCTATFTTVAGGVTACTAVSDPRLKVFSPSPYGLEAVMALHPIRYHWNAEGRKINGIAEDTPDEERIGWNAENVASVIPEAVGTETHDNIDYKNLPHGNDAMVAALVVGMQEQQAELKQQATEIELLKSQIAALQK